jgi:DNA invertase Pin-like site-specific DNA recombinase
MHLEAYKIDPKSSIVGYCSLEQGFFGANDSDHALLNEFCLSLVDDSEIFAEEISPESKTRPMWAQLMHGLNNRSFSEVIFPSLFHIAGINATKTRAFLEFAALNGIRVRTLREQFDTDHDGTEAMLAHLPSVH